MRLTFYIIIAEETFIHSTNRGRIVRNDRCYRNCSDTPLRLAFDSQLFVLTTLLYIPHWQISIHIANPRI